MLEAAAATASAGHPAVAALLGLGTAGLASAVVAMVWSVHTRQVKLAEQLVRHRSTATAEAPAEAPAAEAPATESRAANGHGDQAAAKTNGTSRARPSPPTAIDGPETVVTGEQARYRVRPSSGQQVVSWAVGGGSVSQYADPARPDELLLTADRPGTLTVSVRLREGLTEHRETKAVTAVPEQAAGPLPAISRLGSSVWGLVVVAVLVVGFAGALDALGNLSSADFIALAAPLAALLGVIAVIRGSDDAHPGSGHGKARR